MRDLEDTAGVVPQLLADFVALVARHRKDGELVDSSPVAIVLEIPDRGVDILWFVGGVVGFEEDEGANGVATGGGEVCLGTLYAEPRGKSDEGIVGRREVVTSGYVFGEEVVLL